MTLHERLDQFLSVAPAMPESVHIASGAQVTGDVRLGARCSVWHCAVLRGDINYIEIGEETNVQDGAVVHVADEFPAIIGSRVTVGHCAVIHACTVGDECLIGMHATILDGAVIGAQSLVGAGAVVTQGTVIPRRSLVIGVPARVVRSLLAGELDDLRASAEKYVQVAAAHARSPEPAVGEVVR